MDPMNRQFITALSTIPCEFSQVSFFSIITFLYYWAIKMFHESLVEFRSDQRVGEWSNIWLWLKYIDTTTLVACCIVVNQNWSWCAVNCFEFEDVCFQSICILLRIPCFSLCKFRTITNWNITTRAIFINFIWKIRLSFIFCTHSFE